jgi:hypothetical protein
MVIHEEVPCQESQIGISQHQQGAVPKGGRCPWPRAGVKEVARRCSRVSTRFRCFGRDRFRHGFVASGEIGFVTVSLLRVRAVSSRFRHGFVASGAGLKRANRNQGVQCRLEEIRTHWQQPMARGRQEWQSRSTSTKGPPFAAASTGQHRRRRTSPSTNRSPQCSDRRRWGGGSQGGPA